MAPKQRGRKILRVLCFFPSVHSSVRSMPARTVPAEQSRYFSLTYTDTSGRKALVSQLTTLDKQSMRPCSRVQSVLDVRDRVSRHRRSPERLTDDSSDGLVASRALSSGKEERRNELAGGLPSQVAGPITPPPALRFRKRTGTKRQERIPLLHSCTLFSGPRRPPRSSPLVLHGRPRHHNRFAPPDRVHLWDLISHRTLRTKAGASGP
jgi:hypothetical protein